MMVFMKRFCSQIWEVRKLHHLQCQIVNVHVWEIIQTMQWRLSMELKNFTMGFMRTKMTGFQTMTVLQSWRGRTVNIKGMSWWSSANLQFFAMIPISNLAVAGDVDHGKRSVRSPAETEHCHHDNHLATWCKHRSDWCTLACSNLRRKNTNSEWCSNALVSQQLWRFLLAADSFGRFNNKAKLKFWWLKRFQQ